VSASVAVELLLVVAGIVGTVVELVSALVGLGCSLERLHFVNNRIVAVERVLAALERLWLIVQNWRSSAFD